MATVLSEELLWSGGSSGLLLSLEEEVGSNQLREVAHGAFVCVQSGRVCGHSSPEEKSPQWLGKDVVVRRCRAGREPGEGVPLEVCLTVSLWGRTAITALVSLHLTLTFPRAHLAEDDLDHSPSLTQTEL